MNEISEKAIKLIKDLRRDISIDIMFTPEKNAENNSLKALTDYIAELEAEVTKCHELQDSYCDRIAESESTIELLIEAGKGLLDSLFADPEEDKTYEVMIWKAVVDKVNKEREE